MYLYYKIMKKKIINTSLIIISIFITLYTIETSLIFFPPTIKKDIEYKELKQMTESKGGVYRDKYNELNFLRKEKEIKIPINARYTNLNLYTEFFPLGSISNSDMLHCNENGYYSTFKSDKYGFNNGEYDWDKNQKEIDFFLIGDSYVHGACVNFEDTITGNLKKNNLNVINIGMSGTGPLLQLATLREFKKLKKNKKYIWFYYDGNDLEDLNEELKNPILKMYLNDNTFSQQSPANQYKTDLILENILKKEIDRRKSLEKDYFDIFTRFLKLKNLISLKNEYFRSIKKSQENKPDKKNLLENYSLILKKANIEIQKEKAELIVAYIPHTNVFRNLNNENNKKQIKEIVELNNLKFLDFEKLIKDNVPNPLILFPELSIADSHFNEKGYKFIAEIIKNYK